MQEHISYCANARDGNKNRAIEGRFQVIQLDSGSLTCSRDSRNAPAVDLRIYNSRTQVSRIQVRLKHLSVMAKYMEICWRVSGCNTHVDNFIMLRPI